MSNPQPHSQQSYGQYAQMSYPPQQPQYNQAGPGPSTMQQMQMQAQLQMQMQMQMSGQQQQQQQTYQPQPHSQQQGITPQHMAAFQAMRQANGQGQMSMQQMQMALGQLQAQAQNGNGNGPGAAQAQAFLMAMRDRQFQNNGQQQQQQNRPPMPSSNPNPPPMGMGQMHPTARMQQYIQQQQQQQQQQSMSPDVARVQQMQLAQSGSPAHSSPRQPPFGQGNMPPPPLPTPTPVAQATPPQSQNTRFTPTPTQLQAIAAQQQRTMSDPGFQGMPPAQQQIQLTMIQHRMMSMFAQQHPQPSPGGTSVPSPSQIQGQGQGQSPYSSLPSHMAPRPSSAASQRAPSPRQTTPGPQSPLTHAPTPPQTGPSPSAPSPQLPPRSLSIPNTNTNTNSNAEPQPPRLPWDPAEFPFDPRLLLSFPHMSDPKWRAEMQAKNPGMILAVQHASVMMQQGKVGKDVLERMQQALAALRTAVTEANPAKPSAMGPPAWIPPTTAPAPTPVTQPVPTRQGSISSVPVREWETALRPTMPFTGITPLPADPVPANTPAPADFDPTFGGLLPPVSKVQAGDIRRWLDADKAYLGNFDARKKNVQGKMMNWAKESDMGTPWWMMRKGEVQERRGSGCKIIWPDEKERERGRVLTRAVGRMRREIRFSPRQLKAMAEVEDHVIPIRLDIEEGQHKLKDTFMWNCADTVVSPDLFAQSICDDFNLPAQIFAPKIVAVIGDKAKEYRDQVMPLEPKHEGTGGRLEEGGEEWGVWQRFREEMMRDDESEDTEEVRTDEGGRTEPGVVVVGEDVPVTVEEAMKVWDGQGLGVDDMRILIKVDIMVGTQNLSDTFEWDLSSTVTPEEFALSYTAELGLNGEFSTALAHDIHEQILVHKRCLFLVGHTPGSGYVVDDEVRSSFLPPLSTVLRREEIAMSTFTPIFTNYTEEDVAVIEREREKDSKRKRRATRARRGIILPDREPVKTHRTLLNPLGSNGLVSAFKPEEAVPVPHGHGHPTSRRAAAITAQANINLLSQDLPIPERAPPSPLPVVTQGKRGRGWKGGRGGLSRASPAAGREGTADASGQGGTPNMTSVVPSVFQPPTLPTVPSLKRALGEEAQEPIARKRFAGEESTDVKPTIHINPGPHPTISRSRLNGDGSTATSRSESGSRSPEKRRGSTPRITLTVPRRRVVGDGDEDSSSNSDSSDSDESESAGGQKKRRRKSGTPVLNSHAPTTTIKLSPSAAGRLSAPAPAVTPVQTPTPTPPPFLLAQVPPGVVTPEWFLRAEAETKSRYPKDMFIVVPKGKVEQGQAVEWRLRCIDCPGKIYNLGPGDSFANYEVHLKNRAHISNREKRESGGGA